MSSSWNNDTWNHQPPAAPPMTDADPCVAWNADHAHDHDDRHGHRPGAPYPSYGAPTPPPPAPTVTSPPQVRGAGARVVLLSLAAVALLGAGFGAHELIDGGPVSTAAGRQPASASTASTAVSGSGAGTATSPGPTTPLVAGSDDEPVAAVASALGPSVVVIKNSEGLGSGVVYDATGLILTNAHVVGSAKAVKVTFGDGNVLDGKVLGADVSNDIAVVQVTPSGDLPAARLATTPAQVGQLAVAVGSPFGLDHTVTAGVVSAVNRPVDSNDGVVASMIQTDAPINPGNSGGALANRHGEVIGINTMIFSQNGENNGIGFAIPIEKAKSTADKIVHGDSLARAYLGVSSKASSDGQPGAVIQSVEGGSAAEAAGLSVGDVVTAVDETVIKESGDLAAVIGTHSPGEVVTLTVQRGGAEQKLDATLGAKAAVPASTPTTARRTPTTR